MILWGYSQLLASLEGFEPTTRCLEGSRSVQLSYRDLAQVYHSMEQSIEMERPLPVAPGLAQRPYGLPLFPNPSHCL